MRPNRFGIRLQGTSGLASVCAFFLVFLFAPGVSLHAQKAPAGVWEGYDGEWQHVSEQLIALAEATPEDKFAWRPAQGVRSTSEVYMHIVVANFYLLSITGPKMPPISKTMRRRPSPPRPKSLRGSSALSKP